MAADITKLVDLEAIPPLDCSRSFEQLAQDAYEYWLDLQCDDGAPFEVFMSEPWRVLQNCYCVLVKDRMVDPLAHLKGKRGVGRLRYQLALRHAHEITMAYPQLLFEASKEFPELIGGRAHSGSDYVRKPLHYPYYENGNSEHRIQARRARQAVTLTVAPTPSAQTPAGAAPMHGVLGAISRLLFGSPTAKSNANTLPAFHEPENPRGPLLNVTFENKQYDAYGRETFPIRDATRMARCRETMDAVKAQLAELDALGWQSSSEHIASASRRTFNAATRFALLST